MKNLFPALSLLLLSPAALGKSKAPAYPHTHLTLAELPFNSHTNWSYPSMQQSLSLTHSVYDWTHWGMQAIGLDPEQRGWKGFWASLAFVGVDGVLLMSLPLGEAWMHEEWHRAVMGRHGISSYNDVYNLDIGASTIAVSHETDADLIRLKRDHPEDQVRLAEAGMESELAFITRLQTEDFFHGSEIYHLSNYWIATLSVTQYLATCASSESNKITDESHEKDGTSISKRDFIGLDCNGWIRDLNRPDEPYEARGVHPSGVGINRYTAWRDLNRSEQRYLKNASSLTYLNFVDPFLLGIRDFSSSGLFGEGQARFNLNMKFNLTSFGTDLSVNSFYASSAIRAQTQLHMYQNHDRYFPGLELNLFDIPLAGNWYLQTEGIVWEQPKDFLFRTKAGKMGGRLAAQFDYRNGVYQPFVKLATKSEGWFQGEVYQKAGTQMLAGLTVDFHP